MSSNCDDFGQGLEGMRQILQRYTQDQVELDKIDITLLKGIYKDDPNAVATDTSFDSEPNESLL